jgi:hypothetical protein
LLYLDQIALGVARFYTQVFGCEVLRPERGGGIRAV